MKNLLNVTISLACSVLGFYYVYNLIIQLKDFIYYKEQNDTLSEDYYVSKKTVMITGISDDLSVDKSNKLLNSVLESRYGMEYKEARTLGRYHNLYKLLKERINIASKLNDLMTKIYSNESKFLPYIYSRYSIYIGIVLSWLLLGFGLVMSEGVRFYSCHYFYRLGLEKDGKLEEEIPKC
jgi:hypothetical protein